MTVWHENFKLPLQEARIKARQFLNESPAGGYTTIIENWRAALRRSDRICHPTVADGGLMDS